MSLPAKKIINKPCSIKNLKKILCDRFLYLADNDSLSILLNIYDIEESIHNIFPKYISLEALRKDLVNNYSDRPGIDLIVRNISRLIHDDINRFELLIYLEGYMSGFNDFKNINILEMLSLKLLGEQNLYNRSKLFNYDLRNSEIIELKKQLFLSLRKDRQVRFVIKDLLFSLDKRLLKKKLQNLNEHIDVQLSFIDSRSENLANFEHFKFDNKALYTLNRKILRFLYRDAYRVYTNAYWCALNDSVIKRYR